MHSDPVSGNEKIFKRCSAFCTASKYRLGDILLQFESKKIPFTHFRMGNVVHRPFSDEGDIFYFSYGTVVMWGLSKEEEEHVLREVRLFEEAVNDQVESEESRYSIGLVAKILKDDITLPENNVVTKLAFSHGLAQSVKLSFFEKLVERRIEHSNELTVNLAVHGRILKSRKDLSRMMGEIILDRNSINLHTDVLDTPEFFWEYSDLEPLYRLIAQDLDIVSRVIVLNKRLDIVKELFEMLANELQHRHSARLEWIIIVLIFIEVLVTFAKEVFQIL